MHLHLPLLGALAEDVGQHVFDIDVHLLNALVGDDFERRKIALAHVDFHSRSSSLPSRSCWRSFSRVRLATRRMRLPSSTMLPARSRPDVARRRQQNIQQSLFGIQLGFVGNVFELFFAHHLDGDLHQVANHRFDIASDVADFGELRRFHFEERRVGELGQPSRDFGFADAGGADHDDVLGDDFFGQLGREFLAAHAVAQGDGDGALGVLLADDVLVEFRNDFARRQLIECDLFFFSGSR